MGELTLHQKQIFEFIASYQKSHGFPPSVMEIRKEFGFKSNRTVRDYLIALEKKGYIRLHPGKKRGIEVLRPAGIPVFGSIGAGAGIFADENVEDILEIESRFFTDGECFAVKVRGDSMIQAGILEGDYAIIRKQPIAENGQIVAAVIDQEITLKRLVIKKDKIELLPENPAYKPIVFKNNRPIVLGVLVGLVRKY